jgi:Ser/Thr protein kinase RdoA (MazF antagonist)
MINTDQLESYNNLGPDEILQSIENAGYDCNGHIFSLNSYENRVYQVGLYDAEPVIAKFYRPARWSNDQILEEHEYTRELSQYEIPVIVPLSNNGVTLNHFNGFRFAIYPHKNGRAPELDNPKQLTQIGRYVARIHNVGKLKLFNYRPALTIDSFGTDSKNFLLLNKFIPDDLVIPYETLCEDLIIRIQKCFKRAGNIDNIRIHGDCHHGNILWHDGAPNILDFDDARTGPAMQDLWMFLSGDRQYMTARLTDLLDGYTEFCDFNYTQLHLVEALRTLRIMQFSAWIARRWNDQAFPIAFPYFNTRRYWEDHILTLREQAAMMDEPPLELLK